MSEHFPTTGSSVIPTVCYRDVPAALDWLQRAFGLQPHRIVKDGAGAPLYGELSFGTGMVMVAPIQNSPFGKLMALPDEVGGAETQICYLLVDDIFAHHARAKAAGAEMLFDIDVASNGNGYSCRDLEGHVWNVGTYDPWAVEPAEDRSAPQRRRRHALAACTALLIAGAALTWFYAPVRDAGQMALNMLTEVPATVEETEAKPNLAITGRDDSSRHDLQQQLAHEKFARLAAERHLEDLREQLAGERRVREAAELAAKNVHQARAIAPGALEAAEAAAAETRNELATTRQALRVALDRAEAAEKAKQAAEDAREKFTALRGAKQRAEQTAGQMRALALRERRRRIAAERTLRIARTSPYTPYPIDRREK